MSAREAGPGLRGGLRWWGREAEGAFRLMVMGDVAGRPWMGVR